MSPEQVEDEYEENEYDSGGIAAVIVLCIFCPIIPIVLIAEYFEKKDMEKKRRKKQEQKLEEESEEESNINYLEQKLLKIQKVYQDAYLEEQG